MARITLAIDSATAEEARAFIVAFQRTRAYVEARPERENPTVTMMGIGWGVTTPNMPTDQARAMMRLLADQ